ncbi:MAG: ABC transporter substrate-binding protein [Acidimicrobiales bacterium]
MKRTRKLSLALVAILALAGAACGDDDDGGDGDAADGPAISIGAQDFGESAILAEIYAQGLTASGYEATIQAVGGFRDLQMPAFESGDINFAPEYAASMLEFLNDFAGEATADVNETVGLLQGYLDDLGLTALEPSEAVDTNAFVVTQETADDLGLATLSDLAANADGLTLGAPADCETNAFCIPGLQDVYGADLSAGFQALETGAIPDALEAGAIDVALLFSTSAVIADRGWVLLEDDMSMLAADNVVPVVSNDLLDFYGDEFTGRLNEISAALTTESLTELNRLFEIEREDAEDIAADWLADNDLD